MKNYRIEITYDGSRYKGWQVQKNEENTIQGKLQKVLSFLMEEPVEVIGSGRTDAGVHAIAQTANFHLEEALAGLRLQQAGCCPKPGTPLEEALLIYLNRYLPEDIAVKRVIEVPDRFHARYSAISKTYRYRIHVSPIPDVFERRYVYTYIDAPLDTGLMRQAAADLCGKHDFAGFCGNKHMKKSTVRTISSIVITEIKNEDDSVKEIRIDYTGDGFLQNMVRILTGTLIEVGSGRREADSMPALLEAKDRQQAGYTAPAQGLALLGVEY